MLEVLTHDDLKDIILRGESDTVEFKRDYKRQKIQKDKGTGGGKGRVNIKEHVLHILCLANAFSMNPRRRYLIIGIDDKGGYVGLESDEEPIEFDRLFYDATSDKLPSHKPRITSKIYNITHKKGDCKLDVITIEDCPEKPYFLSKDIQIENGEDKKEKKIIRAGVVYTRTSKRNTAHDSTASYLAIQKMYEERLGLGLSVSKRFALYLNDSQKWTDYTDGETFGYYYDLFPEFRIEKTREQRNLNRTESWMPNSLNATPVGHSYRLLYHTTLIKMVCTYDSGDSNYELCFPKKERDNYIFIKGTIEYGFSVVLFEKNFRPGYDFRKLPGIVVEQRGLL